MEYTTSEIVLAVIIFGIVIFGIFCLIDLIPDDVNDPLDRGRYKVKGKSKMNYNKRKRIMLVVTVILAIITILLLGILPAMGVNIDNIIRRLLMLTIFITVLGWFGLLNLNH